MPARRGVGTGTPFHEPECGELISLNNNNRNNRRRGRGNRNQGGGSNQNRIDNRARGNAPQLLDKYKKLAQDAQHNGDRVQAEYYLQFADHYFRVIADNKARQDEQRSRRDDRDQANDDSDSDDDEDDRRSARRPARQRRDEGEDQSGRRRTRRNRDEDDGGDDNRSDRGGDSDDEPEEKPRKARKPRTPRAKEGEKGVEGEIDAAVLPPSIGSEGEAPARKPRRSRNAAEGEDAGDEGRLSAVG